MLAEPWRGCRMVDQGAFLLGLVIPTLFRDRKLSTSSTANMKSKWVNAFKNIKGKQEAG